MFSVPCQVEGTHREHVQLTEVDAPKVAHVHVDGPPEHIKQVKNTQSEVYSSLVADFDGKLRRGELNGAVLVNYLHHVVGRINRYTWCAPEDCYETFPEEIFMPVEDVTWHETNAVSVGCA